jgi:hypothetical protein
MRHLDELFGISVALTFTAVACLIFAVAYNVLAYPEIMHTPPAVCMGPGK